MKNIIKATGSVSSITFANILTGFIRSKFTAVMLGTAGVGLFSQAFNFLQFAITVASLSIRLGVTKYVAKYSSENDDKKVKETISFAVVSQISVALVFIIVVLLFSKVVSKYLFASEGYGLFVIMLALGIPFVVLSGTFESVLIGFGKYKSFARGRVIAAFLSLVPLFVFISMMKVKGAFLYLLFSALISFLVFYRIMRSNIPAGIFKSIFNVKAIYSKRGDFKGIGKMLISYGGASFITGGLGLFCVVFSRTLLINYLGLDANGLYQVVFAMSAYYVAIFTNGLWSYFYPRVSAISDASEYSREVNSSLRFCIIGIMPFIVGIYMFRKVIINILFSGKFMPAEGLFATQLLGDMFFLLFYLLCTSILASERLRAYLLFGVFYNACLIGIFVSLVHHMGVKAITTSYMLSSFFASLALAMYHIKYLRVKIYPRNIFLFAAAIFVALVVLFTPGGIVINFYKAAFCILCLYMVVTEDERKKAVEFIKIRSGKILKYGQE